MPLHLLVECTDTHGLDLASAPSAPVVRLRRTSHINYDAGGANTPGMRGKLSDLKPMPMAAFQDLVDWLNTATWWSSPSDAPNSRALQGEIHLRGGMRPSALLGLYKLSVSLGRAIQYLSYVYELKIHHSTTLPYSNPRSRGLIHRMRVKTRYSNLSTLRSPRCMRQGQSQLRTPHRHTKRRKQTSRRRTVMLSSTDSANTCSCRNIEYCVLISPRIIVLQGIWDVKLFERRYIELQ